MRRLINISNLFSFILLVCFSISLTGCKDDVEYNIDDYYSFPQECSVEGDGIIDIYNLAKPLFGEETLVIPAAVAIGNAESEDQNILKNMSDGLFRGKRKGSTKLNIYNLEGDLVKTITVYVLSDGSTPSTPNNPDNPDNPGGKDNSEMTDEGDFRISNEEATNIREGRNNILTLQMDYPMVNVSSIFSLTAKAPTIAYLGKISDFESIPLTTTERFSTDAVICDGGAYLIKIGLIKQGTNKTVDCIIKLILETGPMSDDGIPEYIEGRYQFYRTYK